MSKTSFTLSLVFFPPCNYEVRATVFELLQASFVKAGGSDVTTTCSSPNSLPSTQPSTTSIPYHSDIMASATLTSRELEIIVAVASFVKSTGVSHTHSISF